MNIETWIYFMSKCKKFKEGKGRNRSLKMELWSKISLCFSSWTKTNFVDPERQQCQKSSYDDGDEIDATELAPFSKRQDLLRQSNSKPGEIKQNNQYAMNIKP